jgi:hypothetical protein
MPPIEVAVRCRAAGRVGESARLGARRRPGTSSGAARAAKPCPASVALAPEMAGERVGPTTSCTDRRRADSRAFHRLYASERTTAMLLDAISLIHETAPANRGHMFAFTAHAPGLVGGTFELADLAVGPLLLPAPQHRWRSVAQAPATCGCGCGACSTRNATAIYWAVPSMARDVSRPFAPGGTPGGGMAGST